MAKLYKREDGSYTMTDTGINAHPPKFSLDDRLARFRYERKKTEWECS